MTANGGELLPNELSLQQHDIATLSNRYQIAATSDNTRRAYVHRYPPVCVFLSS